MGLSEPADVIRLFDKLTGGRANEQSGATRGEKVSPAHTLPLFWKAGLIQRNVSETLCRGCTSEELDLVVVRTTGRNVPPAD